MASRITGNSIVGSIVPTHIKENIKAPRHCSLLGNPPVIGGFPSQRASDAKMFPFDDVNVIWGFSNMEGIVDAAQYSDVTFNNAPQITDTESFVQQIAQATNKENIKTPYHLSFVRGIYRWSPHIGQ